MSAFSHIMDNSLFDTLQSSCSASAGLDSLNRGNDDNMSIYSQGSSQNSNSSAGSSQHSNSCQEELERQQTILETVLTGLHTSIQQLQEKLIKSTILYIRDQPLTTSENPIATLFSKK